MGHAIAQLLDDRRLAAELGARARDTLVRRFSLSALARRIESVYAYMIRARGRPKAKRQQTAEPPGRGPSRRRVEVPISFPDRRRFLRRWDDIVEEASFHDEAVRSLLTRGDGDR